VYGATLHTNNLTMKGKISQYFCLKSKMWFLSAVYFWQTLLS